MWIEAGSGTVTETPIPQGESQIANNLLALVNTKFEELTQMIYPEFGLDGVPQTIWDSLQKNKSRVNAVRAACAAGAYGVAIVDASIALFQLGELSGEVKLWRTSK